jgi:hypothetical protein
MDALLEACWTGIGTAVAHIEERHGRFVALLAFFLLFALIIGLIVLAFYWYA